MGKLVVSENVSLDGVIQDPRGDEGTGRGDWFTWISAEDRRQWAEAVLAEASDAEALLLGRRTYEFFAARYPSRPGALAERVNGLPKYIVSATLDEPAWNNCKVLRGDVPGEVAALRQNVDGEIVVYASSRLVQTLIEHDLVDEVRLMTYPFVAGAGERLFGATGEVKPMRLIGSRVVGEGIALLAYEPVRRAGVSAG